MKLKQDYIQNNTTHFGCFVRSKDNLRIGNKYKSEILFICKISPFKHISHLEPKEENILLERIPKFLIYGYKNSGRTRHLLKNEKSSWNTRNWVFRRIGREYWICKSMIKSEKTITNRATFWCPNCQK